MAAKRTGFGGGILDDGKPVGERGPFDLIIISKDLSEQIERESGTRCTLPLPRAKRDMWPGARHAHRWLADLVGPMVCLASEAADEGKDAVWYDAAVRAVKRCKRDPAFVEALWAVYTLAGRAWDKPVRRFVHMECPPDAA